MKKTKKIQQKQISNSEKVCCHCYSTKKSIKRKFSNQAWSALLKWEEIKKEIINQPICDVCYNELRLILIERESDIKNSITASNSTTNTLFL